MGRPTKQKRSPGNRRPVSPRRRASRTHGTSKHAANARWRIEDMPGLCEQVEDLITTQGLTDGEVSDFYGISQRTFCRYKARFPELAKACLRGEQKQVEVAERKLFERAVGYRHRDTKIMQYEGKVITKQFERIYPPETPALVAFLKAKKPEQYKERIEHSGDAKSPVRFIIDGRDVDDEGGIDGKREQPAETAG